MDSYSNSNVKEKVIVIMLDVQGTLDDIDDAKCKIFMGQVQEFKDKFQSQKAIINISSQVHNPDSLIPFFNILNRNLFSNIIIDEATYLSGTFDFYKNETKPKYFGYNYNKVEIFEQKYFNKYDVKWFAIIDDTISIEYFSKFKRERPMIICRPSQKSYEDLIDDNLMCHSTFTYGFDGVLECLNSYLSQIQNIKGEDIIQAQRNMVVYQDRKLCINKKDC